MSIVKKYFFHRNSNLQDENIRKQREYFGDREIQTLVSLYRISYNSEFNFSGKVVVDLGCGDMFLKSTLEYRGAKYIPLDIEDVNFNTQKLPIDNESVDVVISLAVIEHIENTDNFINEVHRVMRQSGLFYFTTPNFKFCYKNFYNDPTHIKPYTEVSAAKLLEMYNFTGVNVFPGLRCKPDYMYLRKNAFSRAARIPFVQPKAYLPEWLYGRATSIIGLGLK